MSFDRRFGLIAILITFSLVTSDEAHAQQLHGTAGTSPAAKRGSQVPASYLNASIELPVSVPIPTATPDIVPEANENKAVSATHESPTETYSASRPLFLPEAGKLTPLDKAYLDAYSILRGENQCSRFYGGPAAIEALNRLTRQLKPIYLDRSIGLRMTGQTSYVKNNQSGLSYRLFEKAQLNTNGPFYKTAILPPDTNTRRVGEFSPNTREARVTMLLHELGHMIRTANGDWLLPDDGDDDTISKHNTQRVIDVCRDQIKSRSRVTFEQALATVQSGYVVNSAQIATTAQPSVSDKANTKADAPESLRQFGSQMDALFGPCRPEIQIPQDR